MNCFYLLVHASACACHSCSHQEKERTVTCQLCGVVLRICLAHSLHSGAAPWCT